MLVIIGQSQQGGLM